MEKFYKKNELWFSLVWVVIYVVVMGSMRANYGDGSIYSLLALLAIAAVLTVFIVKNGLLEKYGFTKVNDAGKYLYFIPFILLILVNFRFGAALNYTPGRQITVVLVMALVGYVEELIFRGLLFRAIEKDSAVQAIVITAVTFGIGHIVNLLTGQGSLETVLQIMYAIAIGFSFALVFHKSGSLIPCILTHSAVNVSSTFANGNSPLANEAVWKIIPAVFITIVAGGYAVYLHRKVKQNHVER